MEGSRNKSTLNAATLRPDTDRRREEQRDTKKGIGGLTEIESVIGSNHNHLFEVLLDELSLVGQRGK